MIARLRGTLVQKDLTRAVVDVGGVGYECLVPMSTYDQLPREGETVALLTHLHVREDILQLYGFFTIAERQLFVLLIGVVSGIGPKLALNILSCMRVDQFASAVVNADIKALAKINGIGKRSAERLVVELRDKLAEVAPAAVLGAAPRTAAPPAAEDAIAGLASLGFKADGARKTVLKLIEESGDSLTAEQLIRRALALLNK